MQTISSSSPQPKTHIVLNVNKEKQYRVEIMESTLKRWT